jgi:hypothetical protein
MLQKLRLTFGSKTKAQEILLLLKDAKDVIRQGFYDEELIKVERFCKENNINLVKSRFKVLLADEEGYSNKGMRIPVKDKRPGMFFVYLSKDEEKVLLASYYEMVGNQKDFGLILGYPSCCVDYFCKTFNADNPNPEHAPKYPWTNITKRDKDCVLISHFPCSSDCEGSISLAQKYYEVIAEEDYKRAEELLLALE